MKIGKKQIILIVLAISLIVVGYKYTEITNLFKGNSGQDISGGNDTDNNNGSGDENDGDEDANASASLYFSSNRLERDTSRGKAKEALENITKDENAAEETKSKAYEKIIELTEITAAETKIEGLIREKGFKDAFACFSEKGEIDVLINTDTLDEAKVAQVTDIIIRHSNLDYKDIHIRKVA